LRFVVKRKEKERSLARTDFQLPHRGCVGKIHHVHKSRHASKRFEVR